MSGSVYFTVLVAVVLIVLSVAFSPLFLIPAVLLALFFVLSGPALAMLRSGGAGATSNGTPTTGDAAYEPVSEPEQPAI